jgi:hypothetical protein
VRKFSAGRRSSVMRLRKRTLSPSQVCPDGGAASPVGAEARSSEQHRLLARGRRQTKLDGLDGPVQLTSPLGWEKGRT